MTSEKLSLLITCNPKKVLKICFVLTIVQVFIGVATAICWHLIGIKNDLVAIPLTLFDLSTDSSIPTWFSSLQLLCCSLGFLFIFIHKQWANDYFKNYWLGLSGITLLFSIDEVAQIHEVVGGRLSKIFLTYVNIEGIGFLKYSWVILGWSFLTFLFITYFKFVKKLPQRTKIYFCLSIVIFFSGALIVEMFNAQISSSQGSWSLPYALGTAVEEFCEMLGVSLLLFTTVDYIKEFLGTSKITITNASESQGMRLENYHDV